MHKGLIFVGGLIIGAAGSYFVTKALVTKKKEEEIASIERVFKAQLYPKVNVKEHETVNNPDVGKTAPVQQEPAPSELKQHTFDKTDYTQYAKNTNQYKSDEEVAADIEKAVRENRGYIDATKSFEGRIVTKEEFLDNSEDYGQETLTYYEGDKVIADFNNDIFEETEYLPKDFTQHFDDDIIDKRYERDIVYVMNDDLEMSYEIARDPRCFSDVVQHLE